MTTLNPSHNPFRTPGGRHAQAIHDPKNPPGEDDVISETDSDLGVDDDLNRLPERKARKEGRERVRKHMPPMPDLRFEQSYLLSIRPFLTPAPSSSTLAKKGVPGQEKETGTLVSSTEDDPVFHWGRAVDVNWKMVVYVTLRDQFLSPLVQGALWGWGTLLLASTSYAIRTSLYPESHINKGRITGGPGGKVSQAGGGSAVGGGGWWRNFVKSWAGAVETAAV